MRGTHGERRRWVGAKCGGVWGRVAPLQTTRGSGERHELPQGGPGQISGRKRVLAYLEGHRTLFFDLYDKNLRGTICISVPLLQILGGLVPRVPP